MTHVSSDSDALPPKEAPLSTRLKAAMAASGYDSDRKLGRALGLNDGSLVGKWRKGTVREIRSARHQTKLASLLSTPPDYFREDRSQADRLEELAEMVARGFEALGVSQDQLRPGGDAPSHRADSDRH